MNKYDMNEPKQLYLDVLGLVERLHRRLLDILKDHLDKHGNSEVNAVQALLVYNIGENETTAGELKTRGYYQGSNVSYNLKKLVEMGYLSHERAEHDRRSVRIGLTEKGKEVRDMVDGLYSAQLEELQRDVIIPQEEMIMLRRNLRNLERYWTDKLHYAR